MKLVNNTIYADNGKVIVSKTDETFITKVLTLGVNDSVENYYEIDEILENE